MSTPTSVVIHPLVLLSVVDHYDRVAREANKRAVGVLLGESFKGRVDVTNSFAVPFEEDPKDPRVWFLDHSYLEEMFLMFRKVNMKEKIVGWYSTGPKICNSDLELNEVMRRYTAEPVFTVVDVNPPDDVEIPTTSYLSVEENLKNAKSASATRRTFVHLPTEVGAFEAEEVGVETLLRDIRDNTTSTLTDQVRSRFSALKALHKRMGSIREYLEHVAAGRLPVNHEILYNLQDMFNLSPNLTQEELVSAFQVKTNDHLHVTFMASMVRSVLALHNLIDNKQMNLRVEAESRAKEIAAQQKKDEREKPSKEVPGDPRAGDIKDETDAREGR